MNRFLFLMLLISGQALASDFLSPPASDMSLTMLLQPIFGSLFGGSGDGPLGEAILIFNTGCLTLGGLLAAYTMVFGTMQTAHDGEMLGKKMVFNVGANSLGGRHGGISADWIVLCRANACCLAGDARYWSCRFGMVRICA